MPKNNYLFQARWLEDERLKHWIREKTTLLQYAILALKMHSCRGVKTPPFIPIQF